MATRLIFGRIGAPALGLAVLLTVGSAIAQTQFASKEAAFRQGLSAYKGKQYAIAVPALKFAAGRGYVRAKFYLAKIYSDNSSGWTDHGRAYSILSEIVDRHANVDPRDRRFAPIVANALTSIARYERDGIKSIRLKPSTKRALVFFDHAATYFNDEDAQFELAKHYLSGDGVRARVRYALNWLARLSKRGHAGAQAFLGNLYWDGRYTRKDPALSLALVTVAVENAREEDRFWIEDLHQNIYCEAGTKAKKGALRIVNGWRQRYGRTESVSVSQHDGLNALHGETQRLCANGEVVGKLARPPSNPAGTVSAATASIAGARQPAKAVGSESGGSALMSSRKSSSGLSSLNGFGLRPARGENEPAKTVEERRPSVDRRSLNGFILKGESGSTSFGFSLMPGNNR